MICNGTSARDFQQLPNNVTGLSFFNFVRKTFPSACCPSSVTPNSVMQYISGSATDSAQNDDCTEQTIQFFTLLEGQRNKLLLRALVKQISIFENTQSSKIFFYNPGLDPYMLEW
jgi:hypothetical protein